MKSRSKCTLTTFFVTSVAMVFALRAGSLVSIPVKGEADGFEMEQKNKENFPLEMVDVEPEIADELMKLYTGEHSGFVRVGPKGYFFPHRYREEASRIYNMPLRPDDVFVASFPRSGTTWTQELVWMVANDLDYATSNAVPLTERYPFLEYSTFIHPIMAEKFAAENSHSEQKLEMLKDFCKPATEVLEAATSRRFIKTHLPMSLLPPKLLDQAKMVYVARDPRDAIVSFYHLNRLIRIHGYIGDFKTYWNYFKRDLHYWAPFFDHLKEAWKMRHHPNMLFLFYEDLSEDLPAAVRRVASFFDKQFTDEQVAELCDHLSIDSFKHNKSVNYDVMVQLGVFSSGEEAFIRKGKTGGWRDYFVDDLAQEVEDWMAANLKDTDFRFPHLQTQ